MLMCVGALGGEANMVGGPKPWVSGFRGLGECSGLEDLYKGSRFQVSGLRV